MHGYKGGWQQQSDYNKVQICALLQSIIPSIRAVIDFYARVRVFSRYNNDI